MHILQISGTVHLEISECGESLAALKYFGVRHVSCRFCIFTERGTAERSEASTALAQATQVA